MRRRRRRRRRSNSAAAAGRNFAPVIIVNASEGRAGEAAGGLARIVREIREKVRRFFDCRVKMGEMDE